MYAFRFAGTSQSLARDIRPSANVLNSVAQAFQKGRELRPLRLNLVGDVRDLARALAREVLTVERHRQNLIQDFVFGTEYSQLIGCNQRIK